MLSAKSALTSRIAELESVVAEEFHSLFAVATLQAIKAQGPDGQLDEAKYHASGGGAISAEILRHAERGRRADVDSAHLFMARYQIRASVPTKVSSDVAKPTKPTETPVKERPAARSVPLADEVTTDASEHVENVVIFTDSVRYLQRRGESLAQASSEFGAGKANGLITQCVEAVEHLIDVFSSDDSGCDVADAFLDDLNEASELMILMQVESGDAPAADAVTLLLQLRREMELKLAA